MYTSLNQKKKDSKFSIFMAIDGAVLSMLIGNIRRWKSPTEYRQTIKQLPRYFLFRRNCSIWIFLIWHKSCIIEIFGITRRVQDNLPLLILVQFLKIYYWAFCIWEIYFLTCIHDGLAYTFLFSYSFSRKFFFSLTFSLEEDSIVTKKYLHVKELKKLKV